MLKRIITESGLSRAQLARDSDVSEHSLWSWWTGARSPTGESLDKLAEGLDRRGKRLAELAEELRAEAKGGRDG